MAEQISKKIKELQTTQTGFPDTVISARIDLINKMLLAEETRNALSADLFTDQGGGDTYYDICNNLANQRDVLKGASAGSHLKFNIIPDLYDPNATAPYEPFTTKLKGPSTTSLAVETSNGFVLDSTNIAEYGIVKHTVKNELLTISDNDHITNPSVATVTEETISNFQASSTEILTEVNLTEILYKQSDTSIADIKVDGVVVAQINTLGVITNVGTSGILVDDLASYWSPTNKEIYLKFTAGLTGPGNPQVVTLENFTDNVTGAEPEITPVTMTFDDTDKKFKSTLNAIHTNSIVTEGPLRESIKIFHNGTQIAMSNDTGNLVSMKLSIKDTSFDTTTYELSAAVNDYDYDLALAGNETVSVSYIPKKTDPNASVTLGTLNASTFSLTSLTGTSTFKITDLHNSGTPDTTKNIINNTVKIKLVPTDGTAETILGEGVTGDVNLTNIVSPLTAGSIGTHTVDSLSFDAYPSTDSDIVIEYQYTENIDLFTGTYTMLDLAYASSTVGTETIDVVSFSAVGNLLELDDTLWLRRKDNYLIEEDVNGDQVTLNVICHGLSKNSTWEHTGSYVGAPANDKSLAEDCTTVSNVEFSSLMGWMNMSSDGEDDIMKSANPRVISTLPDAYSAPPSYLGASTIGTVGIHYNPMFPLTYSGDNINASNVVTADSHQWQNSSAGGYGKINAWSTLNGRAWAFDLSSTGSVDITQDGTQATASTRYTDTFIGELTAYSGFTSINNIIIPSTGLSTLVSGYTTVTFNTTSIPAGQKYIRARLGSSGKVQTQKYNNTSVSAVTFTNSGASWVTSDYNCWWNDFVTVYDVQGISARGQINALKTNGLYIDPKEPATPTYIGDTTFWNIINGHSTTVFDNARSTVLSSFTDGEALNFDFSTFKTAFETHRDEANGLASVLTNSSLRLQEIDSRIGVDITSGYSKLLYEAINPMVNDDIGYVKEPIESYFGIDSLYDQFVKDKIKLEWYQRTGL